MIKAKLKKISLPIQARNFFIALLLGMSILGSFSVPLAQVSAQEPALSGATSDSSSDSSSDDLWDCGIRNISGCFLSFFDLVIYKTANYALLLSGGFFDAFVSFSLNSESVDTNFANEGWELTRDMANIGFIFILLYIAFRKILSIGGFTLQSIVIKLIIVALLVNFSLFFTKVVIDASNILALGFYNNISQQELITITDGGEEVATTTPDTTPPTISY